MAKANNTRQFLNEAHKLAVLYLELRKSSIKQFQKPQGVATGI